MANRRIGSNTSSIGLTSEALCKAASSFPLIERRISLAGAALLVVAFLITLLLMAGGFQVRPAYADLTAGAVEADFYAVLHEDGSLVFQLEPSTEDGNVNFPGSLTEYKYENRVPWRAAADKVTSIRFDDSFKDIQPPAPAYWFCGMSKATTIDVTNLDTSKSISIRSLFEGCSSLTEIIGLEALDTSSCTYYGSLFHGCSSLKSLDLRNFDATHVTVMCYLFRNCRSLETLDVTGPGWRTSALLGAVNAFEGCSSLKSLDLSSWDTSMMVSLYRGFAGCTSLEYLDLTGIDCTSIHTFTNLFEGCENLKTVKLGANFSFAGDGTKALCSLPAGDWLSSADGKVYASADVPNHVAATYTRVVEGADESDDNLSGGEASDTGDDASDGELVGDGKGDDNGNGKSGGATVSDTSGNTTGENADTENKASADGGTGADGKSGDNSTKVSISNAKIKIASSLTYTGKALKPAPTVTLSGKTLKAGANYTVTYKNNKNVGTATATINGKGSYTGTVSKTYKITQAVNKVMTKKTSVKKTLKVKALKKKAVTVALPKVTAKFGKAKWKATSKDKESVLTLSGSKVKVNKGAKKGAYVIKLKAGVAATANYSAAATKVVTVKVEVK